MNSQLLSTLVVVVFAFGVIFIRLKASQYPTNARKILIPPLGMSTGFLMFVVPQTRSPWSHILLAIVCGVILSYPLIATSKMYEENGYVYLKRSKGFVVILLTLLIVRLALHHYIEQYVSLPQTAGLFFILAFSMILPWRVVMYRHFRRLRPSPSGQSALQ